MKVRSAPLDGVVVTEGETLYLFFVRALASLASMLVTPRRTQAAGAVRSADGTCASARSGGDILTPYDSIRGDALVSPGISLLPNGRFYRIILLQTKHFAY